MNMIAEGAEARVYDDGIQIIKERIHKTYRIKEIDEKLIKTRNKKEAKILKKLEKLNINAPRLIKVQDNRIYMEKIVGKEAKYCINDEKVLYRIGVLVSKLHNEDIIHGDLTTLNFLVNEEIYIIDFGLSYVSTKIEDKAVDLYVFEKSLICGHSIETMDEFYKGYSVKGNKEVLVKLEKVKLRGRKREC